MYFSLSNQLKYPIQELFRNYIHLFIIVSYFYTYVYSFYFTCFLRQFYSFFHAKMYNIKNVRASVTGGRGATAPQPQSSWKSIQK